MFTVNLTGTESQVTKRKNEERKEGGRGGEGWDAGFAKCTRFLARVRHRFLLGERRLVSAGSGRATRWCVQNLTQVIIEKSCLKLKQINISKFLNSFFGTKS